VAGQQLRAALSAEQRKVLRLVSREVREVVDPTAEQLDLNLNVADPQLPVLKRLAAKLSGLQRLEMDSDDNSDADSDSAQLGEWAECASSREGGQDVWWLGRARCMVLTKLRHRPVGN
jgi:hypothetical protein